MNTTPATLTIPGPSRADFWLDEAVIFLNHGSFGACPRPIFARYQHWQIELERQPVAFLGRQHDDLLATARASLAAYLNAPDDELVFVPNATAGLNAIIRSLALQPGDEILTTDHEYGALDKTWDFVAGRTGARIVRQALPLPLEDEEALIEALWAGVTPRTRVLFLSHITSPTALILPVASLCARARTQGIFTIVDAAHSPGQVDLDLTALGADATSGNCHKWLCAPKGSAFLHVRREHHAWFEPQVISWGWGPGASFAQQNGWQGTRDIAAFLTVPTAIDYQAAHDWPSVRTACHALATHTLATVGHLSGLPPLSSSCYYAQMVALPLPDCDPVAIQTRLREQYRIEIPLTTHAGRIYARVSFQAYNTAEEASALISALRDIFGW